MSIQILSDLHLEIFASYDTHEITPTAPYLALLGDIGTLGKHERELLEFLTRQLRLFQVVFFVPGNHEAYRTSWDNTIAALKRFERHAEGLDASHGKFVLMNRRSFSIPERNLTVLGCSLFSEILQDKKDIIRARVNDFYHTDDWDCETHNAAHYRDLAWLNSEVERLEHDTSTHEIFIFTHWSPSTDARAGDPRHEGSNISSAFATDLSSEPCFKSSLVTSWVFGHTHYNCDFSMDRDGASPLRLVTNQYGYYFSQSPGFDAEKTI